MKKWTTNFKSRILPLAILLATFIGLGSVHAQAPTTWIHPGGNNNRADLDYVKARIAAGEQPWTNRYNQIVAIATPGVANIPADENGMKAEGRKAYANALAWYYSGNVTYANNAIAILNNWGNNFGGFGAPGGQNLLVGGWIGALLGPAAEIMRGYAGWTPAQILVVQNMFRTRFYPVLNQMSTWNGNVDLTQLDAMLNIAVFNEDATLFNSAIARLRLRNPAYFYLSTDPAASRNYATITSQSWNATNWVNGLTQETCRTGGNYNGNGNDNGHHAQYALASAIHAAEVAWNQGVDIYGENETRYIAALELLSTQLYTGSMQNTCADNAAATEFYSTFEMGYNHYANRLGRTLTNTRTFITSRIRVNSASDWNIFYETLTHNLDGFVPGPSCSKPALGADQSICGRSNIVLNTSISGVGKTLTWFRNNASITGQSGTALTITQGGTYRVDVDSAGCRTTDEIVVSNTLTVDLGTDRDLCNPVQYTLDAGNATNAVNYAWSNGASSQTITVSNPGTYTVTVSATNCTSVTDAVVVTSKLLSVNSDTICAAGIANLSVSTTGSYAWYDVATGGTNLGTGVSFSPTIATSRTYYVQDLGGMAGTLGKTNVGAGAAWTIGTADFGAVDKYNLLTVTQAVNLNSLAVYVVTGGANVTINIKQGAVTVFTRTVTNVAAGRQVIPLNFALTPGNYVIDAVGTTANLTFEASGATFPYSYPGYLSFTNNATWQSTWYGLFYDWNITAGNVCARTPVNAVLNPSSPKCSSYVLGTITGVNNLCAGATSSFSVRTVAGVSLYAWTVPAGWIINSGQGTNAVSITTNSVAGTVRVVPVGNSGTGTGSNLLVAVTGNVTPTVAIAASQTSVCANSAVTLTATGANAGTTPVYAWFRNGIATSTGRTFTYSPANGDAITARLTTGGALPTCLSTTTAASTAVNLVVTGNVAPTVAIAASQTSVCSGSTVTFTATGANAGSTPIYAWFRNGIATSTGRTFTYSPANGDAITARLTTGGTLPTCLSTTTVVSTAVNLVVTGNVSPTVAIAASQTSVCSGSAVTFTATGANAGTTPVYAWFRNGIATSTGAIFTYSPANGDAITARVTAGGTLPTCLSTTTAASTAVNLVVTGNLTPTVAIAASQTSVCANSAVTFTATGANAGTTPVYAWFRNGIATSTGRTFTYSPANGDAITARVTAGGTLPTCLSTTTAASTALNLVVTGNVAPTVAIAASQTSVCSGSTVTFTATGANAGTAPVYSWFRNGIATSTGRTFTYSPANGEAISARLTAGGTLPTCLSTTTAASTAVNMVVTGNVSPTVAIAASQTSICSGSTVTFTATGANAGSTPIYAWFRNGIATSTGRTFTYSPSNGDAITARVTSGGTLPTCLSTTTAASTAVNLVVTGNVNPTVAITASQTSVCAGSTVTFTATGANAGTTPVYAWFRNGIATSTGSTFTLTPANGDAITARVTTGGTLPTCLATSSATSASINLTVNPLLNSTVAVSPSANPICAGTNVTFTATPTNGGTTPTYRWIVNNTLQVGAANTFTYVPTNGDVVKAVVQVGGSGNACLANTIATSTGVTINVNGTIPASVSVSASTLTYCAGNTANITASATGTGTAPVYNWYINNVAQANAANTFSFIPSNNDVVKVVMTPGGNGLTCVTGGTSTSNGLSFVVNQNITPSVSIVSSGTTICAGNSVAFSATGVNLGSNPTISWRVNGNAQATGATFAYQPANGDMIQVNASAGGTLPTCLAATSANSNSIGITVNPSVTASVSVNASSTSLCSGTGISLTATGVNAGLNATYTWIKNGNVFSMGNTLNDVPASGDSYAVMVTVGSSTACMTNTTAVSSVISPSVAICPLPNPGAIDGPAFVATGTNNVVYTVPNVNGDSYLWTVPTGATIVSGQGTNAITVSFGSAVATGDITLAQTNANGTTSVSKSVTTGNVPSLVTITGPTTVDPNQTNIVYSVTSVAGTNYQWTVPAGMTIISGQGTNNIVVNVGTSVSGAVELTQTNVFGSSSTSVTVNTSVATDLTDEALMGEIKLYPNPTSANFQISLGKIASEVFVEVTDDHGVLILKSSQANDLGTSLKAGHYIVTIKTNNGVKRFPLVKVD